MEAQNNSTKRFLLIFAARLAVFAALGTLCILASRPVFLGLTDQGGTFHFTFTVDDLDLDGDLDVLAHSMRKPAEFEAYSGGELCINQGGSQGGVAGEFACQQSDRAGGRDATTADLDADGDPDILMFDGFKMTLGINQGGVPGGQTGVFWESISIKPPGGDYDLYRLVTQYGTLAVGDIDSDGRVDAIVLGCCGRAFTADSRGASLPNLSWIWFNRLGADGRFVEEAQSLDALEGLPVAQAKLADLDGDGDLDLAAVALKSKTGVDVEPGGIVLLNNGSGLFTDSGQRLSGKGSASLDLGDLDGDGDLDLLLGYRSGAVVWMDQGGLQAGIPGMFSTPAYIFTGSPSRRVRLADLDGDGDLDGLVGGRRKVLLLLNDGQGKFTRADQSLPFSDEQDFVTGDFNHDGRPDIFVIEYARGSRVWFNDGEGGFEE